jgi:hypothetical protein
VGLVLEAIILQGETTFSQNSARQIMFEILEKSSGKVIGVRVNGKLVHADYAQFVPRLEQLIKEHGSIRCYCELTDFHGITPHALWDEFKFDIKHFKDLERCAMVGDPSWHHWMSTISEKLFSSASVKYFDESQAQEAWDWIYEGIESGAPAEQKATTPTS